MLAPGQRVRVRWSGKSGRVLNPRMPRHQGQESAPGVLVLLDPFITTWCGTTPVTIIGLEVVYAPEHLAGLEEPC
jgi:hypothetical protein